MSLTSGVIIHWRTRQNAHRLSAATRGGVDHGLADEVQVLVADSIRGSGARDGIRGTGLGPPGPFPLTGPAAVPRPDGRDRAHRERRPPIAALNPGGPSGPHGHHQGVGRPHGVQVIRSY